MFSEQTIVKISSTVKQILPAFVNNSESPLTNNSNSNGKTKKNIKNSAENSSVKQRVEIFPAKFNCELESTLIGIKENETLFSEKIKAKMRGLRDQ